MPGFVTHYLFGVDAYRSISQKSFKQNIYKNHFAYCLGLQGPDIFFYYLPSHIIHKTNLGDLAHRQDTEVFFAYLLESRTLFRPGSQEQAIADAYITGFMGHYILDLNVHPYVYAFTKYNAANPRKITEYFGQHTYFETELDNSLLMLKKGLSPSSFHQNSTIFLTPKQRKVISVMLNHAYRCTYPEVMVFPFFVSGATKWMRLGTRLLNDPSGQKKVLVRLAERLLLGNPFISPMVASDRYQFVEDPLNLSHKKWTHPWTLESSDKSFFDLYKTAEAQYRHRISEYCQLIKKGYTEEARREFCKGHGNRSFLSGLPL